MLRASLLILVMLPATLVLPAPASAAERTEDPRRANRRTPVVTVIEECRDAVVNISTSRTMRMRGLGGGPFGDDMFDLPLPRARDRRIQSVGSGAVVHESGYIVTNAHVISKASDVQVTFADGTTVPAEPVSVDPEHDLAVIKVNVDQPLEHIRLGRSDDIMVGETVVAIGNPLGLQHSVTAGIVSALNRDLQISEEVVQRGLIQTDTPINPGNSGGPLLNVNSELIGINTAIRGDAQNIGFAIPVDRLWELLPALLDVEPRERVRFGLRVGGQDARVLEVRPDSPAARAAIETSDRIVEMNGAPIRDGIDYYVALRAQKPDSQIRLTIERNKERLQKDVVLESVPLPDGAKLAAERLGLRLEALSPDARRRLGLPPDVGLIVRGVIAGGPADRAEVIRGDILIRINRLPVGDLQQLGLLLEQLSPGELTLVQGLRQDADWPFFWTVRMRAAGE